ncbi:hypothetical protein ACIBSW_25475 [Actinoplanes sp. NPDC049668]|uniref:hypothetical protein n=1 Tax=unclassified Actinoplanes TaxID=2626549 RepID=UPI0033AB992D
MRLHSLVGRLVLPVAMIGVTGLCATAPAHAAPDSGIASVVIVAPTRVVTTDGRAKSVLFDVFNNGDVGLEGLVVEYNGVDSKIDPSVGFAAPAGCDADSCELGDMAPSTRKRYHFTVDPTADLPALGSSFDISVRDGSGASRSSTTITVVRAAQGVDLEVADIDDVSLAPGKSAPIPLAVRNNGNKAVEGFVVAFPGDRYLSFPNSYRNCVDEQELAGVICFFEQALAPGDVLTFDESKPMNVKVAANAAGPADYLAGVFAFDVDRPDSAVAAARKSAAKRSGDRLVLVPARSAKAVTVYESDLNDWDNVTSFLVKVSANPADLVAIGGTFTGEIGDTRTIKVGVRNDGPADSVEPVPGGYLSTSVTIPSGLKLTKVDRNCVPSADGEPDWDQWGKISGHYYACVPRQGLAKGAEARFSFTAKIENGRNEDGGVLSVNGGAQDPKTANNTAFIDVSVTGSGGGSGGGLPVTGAPAGLLAGGGALLLIGGVIAFVLARRRRIVTVAE